MRTCRDCGGPPRDAIAILCDACLALTSELYRRIATVTGNVDFSAPLEPADLVDYRALLVERLPLLWIAELTPTLRTVEVTVRRPTGARFYHTTKPILGAP